VKTELPKLDWGTVALEPITPGLDIQGASLKGQAPVLLSLNGIGLAVVFEPNMAEVLGRHFHGMEQMKEVLQASAMVFGPEAPGPGEGAEQAIRTLIEKVQQADTFMFEEAARLNAWLETMKKLGIWKMSPKPAGPGDRVQ
jgi:hypothetical protein